MELLSHIVLLVVDLVLPLGVGYACRRLCVGTDVTYDRILMVGIRVVATLLAVTTCWVMALDRQLLWLPVLGVIMQLSGAAFGVVRLRSMSSDMLRQGSYLNAAMLSNRGVVGGLAVLVILGEQGYAYSRLVMLFAPIVVYGICFPLSGMFARQNTTTHDGATGSPSGTPWLAGLRDVLLSPNQIPLLGVLAGLLLNVAGPERPDMFVSVTAVLTHAFAWTTLVPVGHSVRISRLSRYWVTVAELVGVKFLFTPLVTAAVAILIGLQGDAWWTVFILSFAPTAINAVVLAKLNGLDVDLAVAAFVLTTILFLLVVLPLFMIILAG